MRSETPSIWTDEVIAALSSATGVAVETSEVTREAASQDFGHLAQGHSRGVARPESAEQVRQVVAFAKQRGLALTPRGGGLSQSGQSIPRDGLTLDLRAIRSIREPDLARMVVTCGPGTTWRELVAKLLPLGVTPKVTPLNLDLTVGGTLSAGGFGSTSHRYGPAVSNVTSATVVTAEARLVVCGLDRERATFDKVFGGVGRGGVIVDVELSLRRAPANVRTFYLTYDTLDAMTRDQGVLSTAGRVDHVEGFCASTMYGMRKGPTGRRAPLTVWSFGLLVSIEHDDGQEPSQEEVLDGIRPTKVLHVEDDTAAAFAARYDVRFEAMKAMGAWSQPHPWLESLIPHDAALELIPRALAMLPAFLGDGHRIFWVADTDRPAALAFPARGPFLSLAVLPMGVPTAFLQPALGALEALHDMTLAVGGTRYMSGWLFRPIPREDHGGCASVALSNLFESCLPDR